ncbi:unnamed protein product (macronuclear) [Paramecium tetraurelia]|uniref:Uncharacterized protein n=1 Tax=Paramecium tetraurelia TaxID=5888 RepID=A0BP12_PARTE|nr:uncharacterized protein GSPATT00030918001 [Paramecium tetraurelia]CAK60279.1 unnamed protein product [Paramecium tetraurelia]|eukprot:XP_001427677.1 hypothetical protein (macronuclear) [Paramecium tetraurelia strain d4-2]
MKNQLKNMIKQLNQNQAMMFTITVKDKPQYYLKKYEESIIEFDKAIKLNPNYDDYYNSKGQALQNLKKYEESIIEFDKAIELNPNYDDYYNSKG